MHENILGQRRDSEQEMERAWESVLPSTGSSLKCSSQNYELNPGLPMADCTQPIEPSFVAPRVTYWKLEFEARAGIET